MTNKITIKNSVKIIDDKYVIKKKKKNLNDTYNYLISRSFDYFPSVLSEDDDEIYYKFINDINEPKEQKMVDLLLLVGILHNKTTFYREIDLEYYKYIYEEVNKEIDDIRNYYDGLMDIIDNEVYMAPANYLIARNISIVYEMLNYAKESIANWYKLVDNKRKARVVMNHNNLMLEHYLKEDKPYLISWDMAKIDLPVYDLVTLYKRHAIDFDFGDILGIYFSKYPYNQDEMILFLTFISIPSKIVKIDNNYEQVLLVRKEMDYLYKTRDILKKYGIKKETEKGQKFKQED